MNEPRQFGAGEILDFGRYEKVGESIFTCDAKEQHLIRLDRKSLFLIIALLLLFSVFVSLRLHYSSIAIWDTLVTEYDHTGADSRLLIGKPKFIRMDEWRVLTPLILSQAEKNFPVENYSCGPRKTPLLMGLPSFHFSTLFRPQNWGFFVLDLERGFSYLWNYGVVSLVLSSFLLFMLLSGNQFWLSLFGSLFLFFSSFIQWWFMPAIGSMISASNFMVISFAHLLLSKRRFTILWSGALLFFFSAQFALCLYPPFQVILAWLMTFCVLGYFLQHGSMQRVSQLWKWRVWTLFLCISALIIFFSLFYKDVSDTMALALNTDYPGKRVSSGGGFGIDRLFSGFYALFFNEGKFLWVNVCETSSFLLLFPVIFIAMAADCLRGNSRPLQISLSICILLLTFFVVIGFPPTLSKWTLLGLVPSQRAVIGLGIGSILLTVIYMGSCRRAAISGLKQNAVVAFFLLLCFGAYGIFLRAGSGDFFQWWDVVSVSALHTIIVLLLLNRKKLLFCFSVLSFVILSTHGVLPVSSGLGFFHDKKLYRVVKETVAKDPAGKWVVYDSYLHSGFIAACGADVFSGSKHVPDLESMKVFDPTGGLRPIYNRLANVSVTHDNAGEGVGFQLFYDDLFGISVSPYSDRWKELGVKYFLMPAGSGYFNVDEAKGRGIHPISEEPIDGFWILKTGQHGSDGLESGSLGAGRR